MTPSSSGFWKLHHALLGGLTLVLALGGAGILATVFDTGGLAPLEALVVVLYGVLLAWTAHGALIATVGAFAMLRRARRRLERTPLRIPGSDGRTSEDLASERPRTAIVMPIYNEEVSRVFAGLRAMIQSLRKSDCLDEFDLYILSDSTRGDAWLAEEQAWLETCSDFGVRGRLFYRHREDNVARKSGNIAEFCRRWGLRYDYMIVLDADSLVSASAMQRMVREMDRNPRLGLLQLMPSLINGTSLFARVQQFTGSLCGPLLAAGLQSIQRGAGNYWGHNAILRIRPFMEHCGLPRLPGAPPLGGDILSHDFVEAALLVRAGWEVRLLSEVEGSYEEGPPSLLDQAVRDRRWCQGNLQHLRLILSRGLHPMSRFNLLVGVMSYLASPVWLCFLALSIVLAWTGAGASPAGTTAAAAADQMKILLGLFGGTMALLLLPKALGLVAVLVDPRARKAHGGGPAAIASTLLETLLSALLAPGMMIRISRFVFSILAGRSISWSPQQRSANRLRLSEAFRAHWLETLAGVALAVILVIATPDLLWWFAPILVGLLLAAPLSTVTSSDGLGQLSRRLGLFLVPEERRPPALFADFCRQRAQLAWRRAGQPAALDSFELVVGSPLANALHCACLPPAPAESEAAMDPERLLVLRDFAAGGTEALSPAQRDAVLKDALLLRLMHAMTRPGKPALKPATLSDELVRRALA